MLNEISIRKVSRKGQIESDIKDERLNNWYKHFQSLLGNPTHVQENEDEIENITDNANITDASFTQEEYQEAKRSITEGKAGGEDNIVPEVLKRRDLDDEILSFCTKALLEGKKPD